MNNFKVSNLDKLAVAVLRIFLGITFVWIGFLIVQNPSSWSSFLPPFLRQVEYSTQITLAIGAFDTVTGLLLISGKWTAFIAFISALHLVGILIVSGINAITVRDIGLLGASLSLFLFHVPAGLKNKFLVKQKNKDEKES